MARRKIGESILLERERRKAMSDTMNEDTDDEVEEDGEEVKALHRPTGNRTSPRSHSTMRMKKFIKHQQTTRRAFILTLNSGRPLSSTMPNSRRSSERYAVPVTFASAATHLQIATGQSSSAGCGRSRTPPRAFKQRSAVKWLGARLASPSFWSGSAARP